MSQGCRSPAVEIQGTPQRVLRTQSKANSEYGLTHEIFMNPVFFKQGAQQKLPAPPPHQLPALCQF